MSLLITNGLNNSRKKNLAYFKWRYSQTNKKNLTVISIIENNQIIGYEFISLGKMMDFIKKGEDANKALEKATNSYGRFADAAKYIDPRQE